MKKITIEKDGNLYAEVYDFNTLEIEQTTFFSHPNMPLQYGVLCYPKSHSIKRHMHLNIPRKTKEFSEATFILKGEEIVSIFDEQKNLINKLILSKDNLLIIHRGYHSMKILSEFRALEFKVGPFVNCDKIFS